MDDAGDMDVIQHTIQGPGGTVLKTNVNLARTNLIQSTLTADPDPSGIPGNVVGPPTTVPAKESPHGHSDVDTCGPLDAVGATARRLAGWVLALGVALIVARGLACAFAFTATLATALDLGILLLVAGGLPIRDRRLGPRLEGFSVFELTGLLYAVAGVLLVEHLVATAEGLTPMLAAAFLAGRMFRGHRRRDPRLPAAAGWCSTAS